MVESSPLYAEFHRIDLGYLKTLINQNNISLELARKLLDYWELRITEPRDPLYSSYFEYYLFFESVNGGILSAFVYNLKEKVVKHQYGVLAAMTVNILKKIDHDNLPAFIERTENGYVDILDYQQDKLAAYMRTIEFAGTHYLIAITYPLSLQIRNRLKRIENVFKRFYLPDIFQPDNRFLPLFAELDEFALPAILETIRKKEPVTFTYFRFEPYQKYIRLAGEHFAADIINGLVDSLTAKLKKQDTCYVLNPREYLIISHNCEQDVMEKRYYRTLFQIKSLLLNYKVKYTTLTKEINGMADIWSDIIPEIK